MSEVWTIKQLEKIEMRVFIETILQERWNKLTNPYSPLSAKLKQAQKWVNKVGDKIDGEELEDELFSLVERVFAHIMSERGKIEPLATDTEKIDAIRHIIKVGLDVDIRKKPY